jgi:EF-P beta-lysylation protein EpmB
MVARSGAICQIPRWRRDLASAFKEPAELLGYLGLDPDSLPTGHAGLPLLAPRGFADCMEAGNPDDPLLRQILPSALEEQRCAGFVNDPVGDTNALRTPGLLQKYPGRALLIATTRCAVHCRYCFRRHLRQNWLATPSSRIPGALTEIAADDSIRELILSGGDPLLLGDTQLTHLINAIEAVPHLHRLRIHTRVPIVLPSRVTAELCRLLATTRLQVLVVVQVNHAHELSESSYGALAALRRADTQLLNQSVLLRGVNDDAASLIRLSEALSDGGVLPYYLHLLDRVRGAAHFEVGEARACELMGEVRARMPGYLVPRLVREEAGGSAKTLIG